MHTSYIKAATKKDQFPELEAAEFAFVGRSNSGKSSLLNCLTNNSKLARTSSTPGRTQMVHFFEWQKDIIFADLPGYGYNKASKSTEEKWNRLAGDYLTRQNLAGVLYLTDVRRGFGENELEHMSQIGRHVDLFVVLTKIDKCNQKEMAKQKLRSKKDFDRNIQEHRVFALSNQSKKGIPQLRLAIEESARLFNEG